MNTLIRCVLAQFVFLHAVLAHAATDPADAVADSRAKYADQPSEHIACLEQALQVRGGTRQEIAKPPALGSEQVRAKQPKETVQQATVEIENVTYGFDGVGLFRMADGQVWKGTESTPQHQRLEPGKRYAARIERGSLGGYKLYVEGVPRMVRVVRTN
jgi:hypothetical protein